jgi:hypothetical protein
MYSVTLKCTPLYAEAFVYYFNLGIDNGKEIRKTIHRQCS